MTKLEANFTQVVNQGAKNDLKAAKLVVELMTRFPEPVKKENVKAMETSVREKLLAALERHEGDENK